MSSGIQKRSPSEEMQARLQLALEVSGSGMWDYRPDTGEVIFDQNMLGMLGYASQEFPHTLETWFQLLHPEDRPLAKSRINEFIKGKRDNYESLFRMHAKDGTWRWIQSRGQAVEWNEEGRVSRMLGLYTDVTERERARKELALSDERHRSLLEHTSEAIFCFEYDPPVPIDTPIDEQVRRLYDGVLVECNDIFARKYGATKPQQVIGKKLTDLIGPSSGNRDRLFRRFINGNYTMVDGESIEVLPDGTERVFLNTGQGVVEDGRLRRVWGAFRDVTAWKNVEQELRHEQERAQLYLDIAEVVLLAIDSDQRVTLINRRGCDLLGYEESELLGQNWFDLCVPETDRQQTRTVFEMLMKGDIQSVEHFENWVVKRDGNRRLVAWRNALVRNDSGRIIGTLSSGEDVTERRQLQEAMIQTEKMMTVGGLAAGMAHEINSPLSGILQGVQNIVRRVSPEIPSNREVASRCGVDLTKMEDYLREREVFSFLSGIQDSGTRAARIIRNMLQFSRRSDAEHTPVDLNELVDRALELAATDYDLKKRHDFREFRVDRQYDRALRQVECIPNEIEQVVLNIVKNAAEAMSDHVVPGRQPMLALRTRQEDAWACIEIEDNGPGIEDEVKRRVFEPFFTTKGVGAGTGLGLAISYFIVTNNHQGTISLESSVDEGTKFIVRLPLDRDGSRPRGSD